MDNPVVQPTNLNGPAFAALILGCILILCLPRKLACLPLLATVCLMPLGQRIVVMGLDLTLFRIVLLAGLIRVAVRGEVKSFSIVRTDRLFFWWLFAIIVFGSLSSPSISLLVSRCGSAYNALGTYVFVRSLVRSLDDILAHVRILALLCLPIAILMLIEKHTGRNLLSVFGGVPEWIEIRDGKPRCQAAFAHPILAGTFGAAQIPLFIAMFKWKKHRALASTGLLSCTAIAFTASSTGAALAAVAAFAGMVFWKWRRWLRIAIWAGISGTVALAIVTLQPPWHVFARLGNLLGGAGWHRAWLLDQFFGRMDEWWLFGTTYTAHWGPAGQVLAGYTHMMDITNHYVAEGISGGLLQLVLFLSLIISSYGSLKNRLVLKQDDLRSRILIWALGVSLTVHCLSFLSVSYFDQTVIIWYWLLSIVSSLATNPAAARLPSKVWRAKYAG